MRDLAKEIERASLFRGKWDQSVLNSLIDLFMNSDKANNVVCDFDSGEEICGFFKGSQLVAYVHLKFPIGFAKKEFICFATRFKNNIHVVAIDDFDTPEWFVDMNILQSFSPELSWYESEDAVNPNCFSIDDFRFAIH